ncbi:MAG: hypothetical protein QM767_25490 [Anaeromyxobacter sp.]
MALALASGTLAMASTSPVDGSSTTAMPESAREPATARASAVSAVACSPWSMVSSMREPSRSRPGTGGEVTMMRPLPSRSEGSSAGMPCRSASRASSTPSRPSPSSSTTPSSCPASSALG